MRKFLLFLLLLMMAYLPNGQAQIDAGFVRDSIEIERGIPGTPDFEPHFRLVNSAFDDNNRPLRSVIYRYETETDLVPNQRQTFEYDEEGNTTFFLLEEWNVAAAEWRPLKQEENTYENGRLATSLRKKPMGGTLQNRRQWIYQYNMSGMETGKLLQGWNADMGSWENLSRKTITYDNDGHITEQLLERYNGGSWKNSRRRIWTWEPGAMQPTETVAQIWSTSEQDWANDTRKSYNMGNNGLWTNATIEQWNPTSQEWENDLQEQFMIDLATAESTYSLTKWNGAWEPNLRGQFTYSVADTEALLQSWNETEMQYINAQRSQLRFNPARLPAQQTGMQIWNNDAASWHNNEDTRRTTYFWRPTSPNSTTEVIQNVCTIPNPYASEATIACELLQADFPLQLEVFNLYGQLVRRQQVYNSSFAVETAALPSGLYVFKLSDDQMIYQLQKVVVAH